jgi:acetyl-CoA carboxylase biotin carboxyl carrier protein
MDIQNVITLIDAVSSANIMNFQIEEGNFRLSMDKLTQKIEVTPSPTQAESVAQVGTNTKAAIQNVEVETITSPKIESPSSPAKVVEDVNIKLVESPIVGTYYSSAGPDSGEFVKLGDTVKVGQTLCIVEAMKLMNDIESDFAGEIVEILVKNEQMVEYGQPLFKIRV